MTINIRLLTFALTMAFILLLPQIAGAQGFGPVDNNTYYNGTTLTYHQRPHFNQCQADCANNPNCKAFTWIQPGTYKATDPAMCYLVSAVTGKVSAAGHHSAVKRTAGGTLREGGLLQGRWTNSNVQFYNVVQRGDTFTWTREGSDEVGQGKITGADTVEARWTGGGYATGTIYRNSNGTPYLIKWSNGVNFTRK